MAPVSGKVAPEPESALSAPVKALLEAQGYDVKGEIRGCDLVGVRGDDPPVIVELKRTFSLALVHQGIDRLAMSDAVYLAVGTWPPRAAEVRRLCRRLGLGLIVVTGGRADVLVDPTPYRPRQDLRRAGRLLREHQRRVGDPMPGGSTRVPVMTAYRQQALRCARLLEAGPMTPRAMRLVADVPNAGPILRDDVYGWFERIARGTYALTPKGREALDADLALHPATMADQ
ncbi:MAG TPA: DUF2161 family putative PD-(D/E)XK-type phosphodiesterase [Candidatus Limnocylindrales bacterium]|nr:DUF2161 family putative PD-(D/E)XK-type phosphodiesterase [Candidatus Limnocylindrales bacterium]